eukprot:m.29791 g.29791  ORF g.29791 m.29791 type:complete len:441 (-) comp8136_c1_seq1:46-1368(-)
MFSELLSSDNAIKELSKPDYVLRYCVLMQMGAEKMVALELQELQKECDFITHLCPCGVKGIVGICVPRELSTAEDTGDNSDKLGSLRKLLLSLRTVIDVLEFHCIIELPNDYATDSELPLKLYEYVRNLSDPIPSLRKANGFRVTTSRIGMHNFQCREIEYEVGGALSEKYAVKPVMRDPGGEFLWQNIRADVIGNKVLIGTRLNKEELSKRHKIEFLNRVTIKSNIAAMMVREAKLTPGCHILDPFCGSGTILLEAAAIMKKDIVGRGSDSLDKVVKGAIRNAEYEGHLDILEFQHGSAVGISNMYTEHEFDAVITNPPWGVQTGQTTNLETLYKKFLSGVSRVLKPGGRLVVFMLRALQFLDILRGYGQFVLLSSTVVRTRNNLPTIFVLEKQKDEQRDMLKRQLRELSPFVNFSEVIFNVIHDQEKHKDRQGKSENP